MGDPVAAGPQEPELSVKDDYKDHEQEKMGLEEGGGFFIGLFAQEDGPLLP